MSGKTTVLCIVGPTATGKTALSVALAQKLNGEIVSADAVAVYRKLDIGSAKPTEEERRGIAHHLIDCINIEQADFSVSVFRKLAREAIDGIAQRNALPIVVGGSGLYLDAIFSDMRFSAPSETALRTELETEYDADRNAFFALLSASDPATAKRLHPNDKKRIVRAMEVFRLTGRPFSELNHDFACAQEGDGTYRTVRIGLNTDRQKLYERIDRRVDDMVARGLIKEAYDLFDDGYTPDRFTAMQSIGYAQLYESYRGMCSTEEAIDAIKLATRHFAKRQITWFKRNPDTVWFDPLETKTEEIVSKCTELLYEHR